MKMYDYVFTDDFKALNERYKAQFDVDITTFQFMDMTVEAFKSMIEQCIADNEPLYPHGVDI